MNAQDIQALREARKARKLLVAPQPAARILERHWLNLDLANKSTSSVRLLSWNLLAQTLVRRELFPTSNCLKASQREHMLHREVLRNSADILCLQEVDRLDKLLPVLEHEGYSSHWAVGPGKKHGCLIAFKADRFLKIEDKIIHYDDLKNIGYMLALQGRSKSTGLIVATTHLFWHPSYTYERARQAAILRQQVLNFRSELNLDEWPCILAGDFNFAPDDASYTLLRGEPLLPTQEMQLQRSSVIHQSIDPTVPTTTTEAVDEENGDPDRVITNARVALPSDGLLSPAEFSLLFQSTWPLRSAYDIGLQKYRDAGGAVRTFGDRVSLVESRSGRHEPEYTSYTHYWKTVLDYIFIMDSPSCHVAISGLLAPPQSHTELEPGLPQKDVCGSDHISLCADLELAFDT